MVKDWLVPAKMTTHRVQRWLAGPTAVSVWHIFDQVLNLVDGLGKIISVVQPPVGPGPFALVVDERRPFSSRISINDPVRKTAGRLEIGPMRVDLRPAAAWQPVPRWQRLKEKQAFWLDLLPHLQTAVTHQKDRLTDGSAAAFAAQFSLATAAMQQAISQPDAPGLETAAAGLAGLGPGLTPAGDDYLLGLMLGLWATRSEAEAAKLAASIVEAALPRTTRLSAAWLGAAAQGEAALAWHNLVEALLARAGWETAVERILSTGASSGIAAFLGFVSTAAATNSFSLR